ncbi:Nucleolar protein 16 [Porphyridium purpureum]|uniref:Nucleolar protein 16 n=1 Tax=Porphyridium purpureum TaxID=35688 RepID=A0A5J4YSW2_PORPP|nr:Nucleolar protein 16 [Porphyridium purpureum]|eukprot:POR5547..scf227_4
MVKRKPSTGATKSGSAQKRHRKRLHSQKTGKVFKQHVADATVREAWDNSKNVRENLDAIGLAARANAPLNNKAKASGDAQTAVVARMEELAAVGEKEAPRHPAEGEAQVLEKLIAKHGDDYEAMARDIKINTMQHTSRVLERRVRRYLMSKPHSTSRSD